MTDAKQSGAVSQAADPSAVEASFTLAPMQAGMLFNSLYAPGSGVDLLMGVIGIDEALDVPRFARAWQRVVDVHAALRTAFRWDGLDQPLQDVHRSARLDVRREDWSGLPDDEQERRWAERMRLDRSEGFDMRVPPLMRLTVVRSGPERWRVLWPIHHALLDTFAMTILARQAFGTYDALGRGETHPIEPTVTQRAYSDWFEALDVGLAEPFWRRHLAGLTAPTRLGIDRGEAAAVSAVGAAAVQSVQQLTLPAAFTATLSAWARERRVTLNTVVQGLWALILARTSGERRVVFGAVKSGRRSCMPGAERMIGLALNTLPFVVDVDEQAGVDDWLAGLREQWVALREFEHTPLVRMKEWSEVAGRRPLFESVLCFDGTDYDTMLRADGGDWSTRRLDIFGQPDAPLTVNAYGGDALTLRVTHDERRIEHAAVTRMLAQMRTLLAGLVEHPSARLADLPLLPDEERQLLLDWNDTARAFPDAGCLHEPFEEQVRRAPDAVALIGGEGALSYRELDARANRLARCLAEDGIGPGTRVGLCVERSADAIVAILGVLKAGGAYVPLDPEHPPARLSEMMAIADVSLVVAQRATRDAAARLVGDGGAPALLCLDGDRERIERHSAEPAGVAVAPTDLAYVLFTSGSTGHPKGVGMPHGPLVNLMRWQREHSAGGAGTRTLQFAPLGFDVHCQEIFATLGEGGTLCLIDEARRRHPETLLAAVHEHAVTRLFLPFVALQQLVEVAVARDAVPGCLAEVITAGEPLQVGSTLVAFFRRAPRCRLVNQYGPTECHVVTAHELSGAPEDWPALPPIGSPIANTQVWLLDHALRPVPVGVPGDLYIGGAAVGRGYVGDEAATARAFLPDPFRATPEARLYRTGDRARWRSDGAIEFLGRSDAQVKLRGFRVEPGEVESVLLEHPRVGQAAAVVREDRPGDARLVAYVVIDGADADAAPAPSELRDALRARLPGHMVPSAVVVLDALPLTASGKLDRRRLPAPEGRQVGTAFLAPRGPTEERLAAIWREVLGLERVGVHDDFFELGGHSLLAMRVGSRVRDAFGVDVPVPLLFEAPSIGSLTEHVETLRRAADAAGTAQDSGVGSRYGGSHGGSHAGDDAGDDEEFEI